MMKLRLHGKKKMPPILIVYDVDNQIVEKIPATSNSTEQMELLKETKQRYAGQNMVYRFVNQSVDQELFNSTKALLERIAAEVPEMGLNVRVEDRPEGKFLRYDFDKKRLQKDRNKRG